MGSMTAKQKLGLIILVIPFVVVFGFGVWLIGWLPIISIYFAVAMFYASGVLGFWLLNGGYDKEKP